MSVSGHLVSPAGRDMVCGMEEGVAEITWGGRNHLGWQKSLGLAGGRLGLWSRTRGGHSEQTQLMKVCNYKDGCGQL